MLGRLMAGTRSQPSTGSWAVAPPSAPRLAAQALAMRASMTGKRWPRHPSWSSASLQTDPLTTPRQAVARRRPLVVHFHKRVADGQLLAEGDSPDGDGAARCGSRGRDPAVTVNGANALPGATSPTEKPALRSRRPARSGFYSRVQLGARIPPAADQRERWCRLSPSGQRGPGADCGGRKPFRECVSPKCRRCQRGSDSRLSDEARAPRVCPSPWSLPPGNRGVGGRDAVGLSWGVIWRTRGPASPDRLEPNRSLGPARSGCRRRLAPPRAPSGRR